MCSRGAPNQPVRISGKIVDGLLEIAAANGGEPIPEAALSSDSFTPLTSSLGSSQGPMNTEAQMWSRRRHVLS
jgi:hypothetical protein